jgi:GT2 family glycosyltransferase
VLVIDNASRRENYEELKRQLPAGCGLLRRRRNGAITGGMNSGLRQALRDNVDYAWTLNNDAFPEPDCLERLIGVMDANPQLMITTPKLMFPDGTEQHAGGSIVWSRGEVTVSNAEELTGPSHWGRWLTGTAILIRTVPLRAVGLYDERLFAYWEDADLSMRVVRAGGELQAVPEARCYHGRAVSAGGDEGPFLNYFMYRNNVHFIRRYVPVSDWPHAYSDLAARTVEWAEELVARGKRVSALATIAGFLAGVRMEYGVPPRLRSRTGLEGYFLNRSEETRSFLRALTPRLENKRRAWLALPFLLLQRVKADQGRPGK